MSDQQKMILAKPPKPPNQMTAAERKAWADQIFEAIAAQHAPKP